MIEIMPSVEYHSSTKKRRWSRVYYTSKWTVLEKRRHFID